MHIILSKTTHGSHWFNESDAMIEFNNTNQLEWIANDVDDYGTNPKLPCSPMLQLHSILIHNATKPISFAQGNIGFGKFDQKTVSQIGTQT